MDLQNAIASLGGYNVLLATLEQSLIGINLCMKALPTSDERAECEKSIHLFDNLYTVVEEIRDLPAAINREALKDILRDAALAKDARLLLGIQDVAPTPEDKSGILEKLRPTHEVFLAYRGRRRVTPDRLQTAHDSLLQLLRMIDHRTSDRRVQCEMMLRAAQPGLTPPSPL